MAISQVQFTKNTPDFGPIEDKARLEKTAEAVADLSQGSPYCRDVVKRLAWQVLVADFEMLPLGATVNVDLHALADRVNGLLSVMPSHNGVLYDQRVARV